MRSPSAVTVTVSCVAPITALAFVVGVMTRVVWFGSEATSFLTNVSACPDPQQSPTASLRVRCVAAPPVVWAT